jgi:hypothetical protein
LTVCTSISKQQVRPINMPLCTAGASRAPATAVAAQLQLGARHLMRPDPDTTKGSDKTRAARTLRSKRAAHQWFLCATRGVLRQVGPNKAPGPQAGRHHHSAQQILDDASPPTHAAATARPTFSAAAAAGARMVMPRTRACSARGRCGPRGLAGRVMSASARPRRPSGRRARAAAAAAVASGARPLIACRAAASCVIR